AQYRTAEGYADRLPVDQQAELLEGLAHECYLTSQLEEAACARERALTIWRTLDNIEKVGHNLRWLSRLKWYLGQNAEAERCAEEALSLLTMLPSSRELAMAYSNRAHLCMLTLDPANAVLWGTRAIELAERLEDVETLCHTLNTVGMAELEGGDDHGQAKVERSLQLALEH